MRKILLFLCTFILFYTLPNILAECGEGQININSASLEELDKLSGIGPAYANAIINSRPFSSIDNLIDVKGIGPVTLEKIKTQGLACVEGEQENTPEESTQKEEDEVAQEEQTVQEEESIKEEPVKEDEKTKEDTSINNKESSKVATPAQEITKEEIKTITLTPQSIKSEINKEELSKNKLSFYGLITFCLLITFLFVLKKRKDEKTEFK
jgi:competence ComEA-like helix-hairpin-helix protein